MKIIISILLLTISTFTYAEYEVKISKEEATLVKAYSKCVASAKSVNDIYECDEESSMRDNFKDCTFNQASFEECDGEFNSREDEYYDVAAPLSKEEHYDLYDKCIEILTDHVEKKTEVKWDKFVSEADAYLVSIMSDKTVNFMAEGMSAEEYKEDRIYEVERVCKKALEYLVFQAEMEEEFQEAEDK